MCRDSWRPSGSKVKGKAVTKNTKWVISKMPVCIVVVALVALWLSLGGCGESGEANDPETAAYIEEIETWRAERVERLKSPDGWLSLSGLYWLDEEKNSFGSDASNDVVFPEGKAPLNMGLLVLDNGEVRMELESGVDVTSNGHPVGSMVLFHDSDEEHETTVLSHGPLTWYAIKRGERIGIRVKDSESKDLREFKGIDSYPVDPAMRLAGVLEPRESIEITNVLGVVSQERSPGRLVFEIDGKTLRLDGIAYDEDDDLFIVFGDRSNGKETYGGGRFLVVERPGDDGKVVIDFNRAYNPPCAFTKYATCPLPPEQNILPVSIHAGEKTYKKPGH